MESSAGFAAHCRELGWKLYSHQDPAETPVRLFDGWFILDDDFGKTPTEEPE
jgi:hypothetical protein